jgi:hypothetical protein
MSSCRRPDNRHMRCRELVAVVPSMVIVSSAITAAVPPGKTRLEMFAAAALADGFCRFFCQEQPPFAAAARVGVMAARVPRSGCRRRCSFAEKTFMNHRDAKEIYRNACTSIAHLFHDNGSSLQTVGQQQVPPRVLNSRLTLK